MLITESPPCPDDEWNKPPYIYRLREGGNSLLAGALVCGFFGEAALAWDYRKRLTELRKERAGIIDVCECPVNKHLTKKSRLATAVAALKGDFFDRLDNLEPVNVILLGAQKKGKYAYEVRNLLPTRVESILRNKESIPLPHGGGHNFEHCWKGIQKCVRETRSEGK